MDFLLQSGARRAFVGITLSLSAWAACAESPADERLLGLAEQDVVVAVPDVKKMARPAVGPHGLRGLLTLAHSDTTSLSGELTFYFRKSLLERIEERKRLPEPQCKGAYATLLASLSTRYGTGIYSDGDNANASQNGSAAWVLDNFKVMAYRLQGVNQCDLLVAIEQREQRDASEL
jgi:hypothetical protein